MIFQKILTQNMKQSEQKQNRIFSFIRIQIY